MMRYLKASLVGLGSVVGFIVLVSRPHLVNAGIKGLLLQPTEPETRTTKTGAVFTRDDGQPKLGDAWRDPSGLIWGRNQVRMMAIAITMIKSCRIFRIIGFGRHR